MAEPRQLSKPLQPLGKGRPEITHIVAGICPLQCNARAYCSLITANWQEVIRDIIVIISVFYFIARSHFYHIKKLTTAILFPPGRGGSEILLSSGLQ